MLQVDDELDVWTTSEGVAVLHDLLAAERQRQQAASGETDVPLVDTLSTVLANGGKRLRPVFAHWGHVSVDGSTPGRSGAVLGAALELVHTFAIVHDDVMDGSDTRRGQPSAHAAFAASHHADGLLGERRRYAEGMAVLVGDLAFALANRLVTGLPAHTQGLWHDMCSELVLGQQLDLAGAAGGSTCPRYASRVAALKSGLYTVVRPLQLGASLADGSDETLAALAAYGGPLGEAFQLCDDLLGAYGEPERTGKPVGTDIRDGKPTVLLALVVERAPASAAGVLARLGTPAADDRTVAEVLDLAERTGARAEVERRVEQAVAAVRDATQHPALHPAARPALQQLADRITRWSA